MRHPLLLVLASLILFPFSVPAGERVAAEVNGESITVAELDAAVGRVPMAAGAESPVQKRQLRQDVLQALIEDRLIRQFLRRHGTKVDPADVERQYAALEAGQKKEGKSAEQYLKDIGLTPDLARENFRFMLQLARYTDTQATDSRLRAYFEANRDFFDRTTVKTSHIVIRTPATASPAEREKAVARLRAVRNDLTVRKVDFATAAKTHSQCPSGPMGGDVGWIVRKFQADEAYARTAFGMKVGEVSDVVETEVGYHLIWVTDRKQGKPARYEESALDVRQCFEAELKQQLVAELRKKAIIDIKVD